MAAVVTTLKLKNDRVESLYSFISYHLTIGFEHIFLFFDDENDLIAPFWKVLGDRVTCYKKSSKLLENQSKTCTSFNKLYHILNSEVCARYT